MMFFFTHTYKICTRGFSHVVAFLLLLASAIEVDAQTIPSLEWQKCYGGSNNDNFTDIRTNPIPYSVTTGTCTTPTRDGGYILVTSTSSIDGDIDVLQRHQDSWDNFKDSFYNTDIWVVKLSADGETEWEKYYGGNAGDIPYDIKQTRDGGYVLCGQTNSFSGDFYYDTTGIFEILFGSHKDQNKTSGIYDGFIMKLNSFGEKEWMSRIGGSSADNLRKVIETLDSGYLAIGESWSNEEGWNELPWINHPPNPMYNPYNTQLTDGLIVKLTADGKKAWNRLLGGSEDEVFYDIVESGHGTYAILGKTEFDGAGDENLRDGDVVQPLPWTRGDRVWFVEVNSNGAIHRQKCFGSADGTEMPRSLIPSDHGYLVTTFTNTVGSRYDDDDVESSYSTQVHRNYDVWMVKLDNDLNIVSQRTIGGFSNDKLTTLTQTSKGTYLFAGRTNSTDGDLTGVNLSASSGDQVWVGELDEKFDILWQKTLGGSLPDAGNMIFEAENGYMVLGSVVSNDGDVSGNHWGKYGPTSDIWLAKLTTLQSVASTLPQEVNFAYPNPSSGEVNLRIHSDARVKAVEFINPLGMKIPAPYRLSGDILTAETATLSSGMYILEVSYENSTIPTERRKFLKE